jgi:hypothetical protein
MEDFLDFLDRLDKPHLFLFLPDDLAFDPDVLTWIILPGYK